MFHGKHRTNFAVAPEPSPPHTTGALGERVVYISRTLRERLGGPPASCNSAKQLVPKTIPVGCDANCIASNFQVDLFFRCFHGVTA